jgi:hypothetical protein
MNDKRKRKRAAPTIDLTATEVDSAPAGQATSSATPPPEESVSAPQEESQSQAPPFEQPMQETFVLRLARQIVDGVPAAAITGGLAGAALAAAVFAALWFSGVLATASSGQQAEIVKLQRQLADLQNRPPPASGNTAIETLRRRVTKIEHDIAQLPPGDKTVAERLAAVAGQAQQNAAAAEKAVEDLRDRVDSAAKQASTAIDPARLDALQKSVAALERSVAAARMQSAKTPVTDSAARLALSAAALRDAVESGAPYEAALAQAKALGADDKTVAPLAGFAADGLPRKAALAQELSRLIPALLKAAGGQKAPTGFFERLQANAGKLVRISPVNAPEGDDPADVLARLEVDATHADIDAALGDLAKLPAPARAPAQSWIAKAKARRQALGAARQLAADTARALSGPHADGSGKP